MKTNFHEKTRNPLKIYNLWEVTRLGGSDNYATSCKTGFVIYARYHFEIQIPPVKMLNMCSFGLFLEISTLKICEIPRLCYICEYNALPLLSFDYWRILYQFFTFTYFIIRYHTLIRGAISDNKAISKRFRTMS